MPSDLKMKSQNFCITINENASSYNEDKDIFIEYIKNKISNIRYFIFNYEEGLTGNKHMHVYLELEKQQRMQSIIRNIPGSHVEIRYGTQNDAIDYVYKRGRHANKEDTLKRGPYEYGRPKHQGVRNDLLDIKKKIDKGEKFKDLIKDDNNFENGIKFMNNLIRYESLLQKHRDFKTKVIVIYGPSGTGKSVLANTIPDKLNYSKYNLDVIKDGIPHFERYNNEEAVIIDDYSGQGDTCIEYFMFLKLIDRFALTVNVKYGSAIFNAKIIIITSNFKIEKWYPEIDDKSALFRRINCIIYKKSLSEHSFLKNEQVCLDSDKVLELNNVNKNIINSMKFL